MSTRITKLFLRLALAASFLSAVADRLGMWPAEISAWGNWNSFVEYTAMINPWFPEAAIPALALLATVAEVVFALFLLLGFKTELFARLSGFLLLLFAFAMSFSTGIKGAFDYSVFTAAAGAFALSLLKDKYLELDCLIRKTSGR